MKKLLHILLLFIIWIPGVAQVYNMGNLGTITNACGGLFYDSQGPNVQYLNNEFSTVTFCAPAGQAITFTFTDFRLEAGFDFLDVYNGPTTASPLLGSYTGNLGPGVISSTIGGCLTFQFYSDGTNKRRGWEAAISCGDLPPPTNNGDTCPNATAFCTGTTYTFNNNINVPSLGAIDCLNSTPNPVWYYYEIESPGDLNIDIAQFDVFDFPIDVDFLLWGPFSSLPDGCTQIQNSTAPVADCSFSGSAFEQANAVGALAGEVYILLLTNFDNELGYFTFNSASNSTASTNCDILCSITALSATPTVCDPITNTYQVSGELTVTNPPESGILTFTSSCGGTTTLSSPFPSQISYSISGINATGGNCNVVATFSADPSCTITESYTAPASCASVSLNCPDYANVSGSPTTACSNQTYYLEVANTACNGLINLTILGNYGSVDAGEITWQLVSLATNMAVALGGPGVNGGAINVPVLGINPITSGNIFRLDVFDSFGDGFNGTGGTISVVQGTTTIGGPIQGNFGAFVSSIFGANVSISAATITVTTPAGNVVQTVQNCNDFRVPISIENPNFCNTINATLPWTVTCNSTGATLASGSNTLTVYPTLPSSSNDVVSILYNTTTCDWEISGNNDCDAGDIGTIFSISPNPTTLNNTACTGGNQVFDVTYIGVSGGPNCCSTGGPLGPITTNTNYSGLNIEVASSPFGGINNSAYLNIPPNLVGGEATSFSLNFALNGFCYNPQGFGSDYWVTVYVDGAIVSDVNTALTNYNINFDLSDFPNGFNASSNIEIYIYPNVYSSGGINSTFAPLISCGSLGLGQWNFASITTALQVNYSEQAPSPATCLYPTNAAFTCCSPTNVSNASSTICTGESTTAITTWQSAVAAANPSCVVYSSVLPIAGTTAPNNSLPSGINSTAAPILQSVSAYAYCDADGSSTINAGDTYTLISTYNLTVTPIPSAPNLTPALPCAGETVNFTASGGSWYSFTVNGVELQAPSADNTYTSAILTAGDQVCVQSYPTPTFAFNGQITAAEWGVPLATSTGGPTSSFGALNNLDALYLKNMSGSLYGALAGQTENGSNNRFLLFIDCVPGGFNSLASWTNRANAPYFSIENLNNGINFDPGFNPDYILAMNQAFGLGFFDLYNMQTNVNLFLGQTGTSAPLGYQNNGGSGNFTQGFEFAIPLNNLGNPSGTIKAFVMLVNDPGSGNPTFVSNQFLTPAGPADNSYGNAAISFGSAPPNPISYSLSAECSSETCVIITTPVTPTFNPISSFCFGTTAPLLPPTSLNGISGSWNPAAISNTTSANYTFTPNPGICANPVTISINITPLTIPTFSVIPPFCEGTTAPFLPTTSLNGILGSWSPTLISNSASGTYNFTANTGQCADSGTLTTTVIEAPTTTSIYHD